MGKWTLISFNRRIYNGQFNNWNTFEITFVRKPNKKYYEEVFKGCILYIFATCFVWLKKSAFETKKYILLNFESSFRFSESHILIFHIFKYDDVVKYLT